MRWLAGCLDPRGVIDSSRLLTALDPHTASIVERGPLRVAYTGPRASAREPLCLFDGFLDNAADIEGAIAAPRCDPPDLPSSTDRDGGSAGRTSPEPLLAAAWRRWGGELPGRLRGDFALLVWDDERGEGMLARDQLGVRSLFLCEAAGALCFANELRQLLALLPRRPAPDPVGIAHWVAGTGRPGSGTLYAGVRRLDPGCALHLTSDGIRVRRYWSPRFQEPRAMSQAESHDEVREAISLAVRRRLSSSGATGVLMSGGLDSAAVAAIATELLPGSLSAYSGVFPDHPAVDESDLIDVLRSTLQLPGVTVEVGAGGLLASALEVQSAWDAPLVGWGEFWTLPLLRRAAGAGVDVMLGGDGGDELFDTRSYLVADRMRAGHPREALALVRRLPGAAHRPPLTEVIRMTARLALLGALPPAAHRLLGGSLAPVPAWLSASAARDVADSADPLAWKRWQGPRWWGHAAHTLTRGVEELGVFEGLRRTAMLAGMEARHPLFDLDLVELVLSQDPLSSFDSRLSRPLLRASTVGLLPDVVRLRARKAMFDSLIVDSLLGSDAGVVSAILSRPTGELASVVDPRAAREALLEGRSGRHSPFEAAQYLWRLATAELWLKAQAGEDAQLSAAGLQASPPRLRFRTAGGRDGAAAVA
jgi:asparagine synthase (glutamine-hydrolysing)